MFLDLFEIRKIRRGCDKLFNLFLSVPMIYGIMTTDQLLCPAVS